VIRRLLAACLVAMATAVLVIAQTPLTPIMSLAGRTDSTGALRTASATYSGSQTGLTPIGQLRGRTDANGSLLVTFPSGVSTTTLSSTGAAITPGSATGLTISDTGSVRTQIYKVNVLSTAFVCAAVTCDLTIGTLPANTWVQNVTSQLVTTFACTATCTTSTLSLVLGKGSGGAEYLASLDADAAAAIFGDADAEMGTLLTRAAAIQAGTFNATTQTIVLRLTSGTGNIGTGTVTNLSQGSFFIWVQTTVLT
jgi:hypothetical protein